MGAIAGDPSLLEELAARSAEFETAPASNAIAWAVERFGGDVVLACSFQDVVVVDLAVAVEPGIEVLFLDTGFHFPETLAFVEEVRARYGLNLRVLTPGREAEAWPCGTERCCELRKVVPLDAAVTGRGAWLTGLKRVDATTRTAAPIVSWDDARGLVKVNPLATWTDDDVSAYLADHDLPVHPLISQGYLSIGCAPTTRPVAPGEDPRAGRFTGMGKTECGLHE
ncbi:MAG TPA: phosphoadenylyl-sulfate reductase [Acidimicrobiales bacterium]|nr:phosphoadenylyl-sulfate reductase [Acidimicrobiales bacterium]